jgi:hypothetical protein
MDELEADEAEWWETPEDEELAIGIDGNHHEAVFE